MMLEPMMSVEIPFPRVELSVRAELDERRAHSLAPLRDGLYLEVVELVVVSRYLLNREEGRVDGAVADREAEEVSAVLAAVDVRRRADLCCRCL